MASFRVRSNWADRPLALLTVSVETHAQDLEPRAYAPTPVGLNFLIGGYAYAKGAVGTDPSVPIEDAEVELNSAVLAYVRTLDLWGRSGKIDLIVPYTWADGTAKLFGEGRRRKVSGFNDPRLRFSILLYGAPALSFEQFRDYEPDIIIGTSLEVTPPLGQYDSDKLLNIGTNRWSFKPELGISKTLGPLILELATGVRFYTDNDDFLNGRTLQVSPVYSVQGHLIYSITPGIWLGLDGLYYTGARGTIDGRKGESLEKRARGPYPRTTGQPVQLDQTLRQHQRVHQDRGRCRPAWDRLAIPLGWRTLIMSSSDSGKWQMRSG